MSLFSDFLNDRLRPVKIGGQVNGTMCIPVEPQISDDSDSESDTEQQKFVEKELSSYVIEPTDVTGLTYIKDGHEESYLGSELGGLLQIPKAFQAYKFNAYYKQPLPIDSYRLKIMELIKSNAVVIIQGPTGCGKTTQVPQYILDDCKNHNTPCKIVVTQPRRIAAINIAQRVCEERGWALGTVVGYQVGLEKKIDETAVLTYMTTEVLLQKLIYKKNLTEFTHIIIDEVHERSKSLDFLLLIVRKYLCTNSPNVKIILMSATMEAKDFAHYFRTIAPSTNAMPLLAPITTIEKQNEFKYDVFYVENIIGGSRISNLHFEVGDPKICPEQYDLCVRLIEHFVNIDGIEPTTNEPILGSVLVFVPGLHEIDELYGRLSRMNLENIKLEIVPLHSSLPHEHMREAFKSPAKGVRKIILSTNIAESSVTVPHVTYVIDFCLTKVMTVNSLTKFSTLCLEWASHNNCKQRAGRVGRVSNGRVYRLVTKAFYDEEMAAVSEPEMQRAPLENIILYMKVLGLQDTPRNILSLAISPPNLKEVDSCVWHLKEIGALYKQCRGSESTVDGDITFLGRVISALPIDIHLGKLIVLGHMFSCLDEAVIMAAGCTTRNLFTNSFKDRLQCYKKKLLWADGSKSDFVALLHLYNVWLKEKREGSFKSQAEEHAWCCINFVNLKGLKEWEHLIKEIHTRLKRFRIEKPTSRDSVKFTATQKPMVLKVIICGAFYPNYFTRSSEFGQVDCREAVKTISGRDPRNTVYLTNMALEQPCHIYVRQIKKELKCSNNAEISFDMQSSKVFVEFNNVCHPEQVTVDGQQQLATIPRGIPLEVYEAVRRRQLRNAVRLQVLSNKEAWEFATQAGRLQRQQDEEQPSAKGDFTPIPSMDVADLEVKISHIVTAGDFYCQAFTNQTHDYLTSIYNALNAPGVRLEPHIGKVRSGDIYVVMFKEDGKFYRCTITDYLQTRTPTVQVRFIDYGNSQTVQTNQLFDLPSNVAVCKAPPIAFSCTLRGVTPCRIYNETGVWSETAKRLFEEKSANMVLTASVYSVVKDVVHVDLFMPNGTQSFNEWLVVKRFAEKCEEDYLSKSDHEMRVHVQSSTYAKTDAVQLAFNPTRYKDFAAPNVRDSTDIVELKGPFSPLEMHVRGLVRAAENVKVIVEADSVNTVLLDADPENAHATLLVAGQAAQSASANVLKVSQTTVMPSIPGLPMLMILVFCPNMEPKPTADGRRIASILAGMGANKADSRKPYYPMHDLRLNLDTELTSEIIVRVDEMRSTMNDALMVMSNMDSGLSYAEELEPMQRAVIRQLFDLLHLGQKPVELTTTKFSDVWGSSACPDLEILQVAKRQETDIWPMLWFLRLDDTKMASIEDNLKELSDIAKRLVPEKEIVCELCKSTLRNIADVRVHIFRASHKKKLEEYRSASK